MIFINNSFGSSTSTRHSLELLAKFRGTLKQENLQRLLDEKHKMIFNNYGRDVEHVKQLYEDHKDKPILPRNAPIVAGSIGTCIRNVDKFILYSSVVTSATTCHRRTDSTISKNAVDPSIKRCTSDNQIV